MGQMTYEELQSLCDRFANNKTKLERRISELEAERNELLETQVGCQYCNTPLDATEAVGIYECPKCLNNFPNTQTIKQILSRAEAAEKERDELRAENAALRRVVERCALTLRREADRIQAYPFELHENAQRMKILSTDALRVLDAGEG